MGNKITKYVERDIWQNAVIIVLIDGVKEDNLKKTWSTENICQGSKLRTHATFDGAVQKSGWFNKKMRKGGFIGGQEPVPPNLTELLKDWRHLSVGWQRQNTVSDASDTPAGVVPNKICGQ